MRSTAAKSAPASGCCWSNTAQVERGHRLATAALALAGTETATPSRCKTLFAQASHALRLGRYAELESCAERSLAIAREIGAPEWIIDGLSLEGIALRTMGRNAEGLASYEEARDLARATGNADRQARTLIGTGEVHRAEGAAALAERDYREAVGLARRHHELRTIAVGLSNLAMLLIATGRPAEAKAMLVDLRTLRRDSRAGLIVPCVLDTAAALAAALGEFPMAARLHGAMRRNMHESGTRHEPIDEAFVLEWTGRSRAALGDAAEAEGWGLDYDAALAEMDAWLGPGPDEAREALSISVTPVVPVGQASA